MSNPQVSPLSKPVYADKDAPNQHVLTTTTDIPPEVTDFFNGIVGITARRRCVLHYLAEQTTLPAKSGTNLVIPTFKRLPVTEIPYLEEGITPIGAKIQRESLTITPKQLGHYTEVSDHVILQVQDHTLKHFAEILGQHLAESCDRIIADALDKTPNTQYATGGVPDASENAPGYIQGPDILTATNFLKQNSAFLVSPNLFGSTIFGSTPVREAFYAFVHVAVEPDLYQIPGFQALAHYGSSVAAQWLPGEIGEFMNARFVASQNLPKNTTTNGATEAKPHLSNFFVGRYAYYVTRLGGGSTEFIVSKSGYDPLGQRTQIGYKAWFGAQVNTASKWVLRMVSRTRPTI